MDRLEVAKARLSAALDSLEAGVTKRLEEALQSAAPAELELLKGERERLYARIALLEQESRELQGLTQEVEGRLDGAVAELREALGRR
jgi:DNA repair exonuclease SbcCD ATPase subunit